MTTKSKQIATVINRLKEDISTALDQINSILSQVESDTPGTLVVPKTIVQTHMEKAGMEWSTKKGKWVQSYQPVKQGTIKVIDPVSVPSIGTEPRIFNNGVIVPEHFQLLRSNSKSRFWKINVGIHKGAVVVTPKDSLHISKDGRYNGMTRRGANYLATASYDKDGRDYVNRVVRKGQKEKKNFRRIYRIYRPKGAAGHFSHCDLYLAES